MSLGGFELSTTGSAAGDVLLTLQSQLNDFEVAYRSAMKQPTRNQSILERKHSKSSTVQQTSPSDISKENPSISSSSSTPSLTGQGHVLPDVTPHHHNQKQKPASENGVCSCLELINKCYSWTLQATDIIQLVTASHQTLASDEQLISSALQQIDLLLGNNVIAGQGQGHIMDAMREHLNENNSNKSATRGNTLHSDQCRTVYERCVQTKQLLEEKRSELSNGLAIRCTGNPWSGALLLATATSELHLQQQHLRHSQDNVFTSSLTSSIRRQTPSAFGSSFYSSMPSLTSPAMMTSQSRAGVRSAPVQQRRAQYDDNEEDEEDKDTVLAPVWVPNKAFSAAASSRTLSWDGASPRYSDNGEGRRRTWDVDMGDKGRWFTDDVITQDLSHRIVTTLPRARSQSDILSNSSEGRVKTLSEGEGQCSGGGSLRAKPPQARLLRKAISCVISPANGSTDWTIGVPATTSNGQTSPSTVAFEMTDSANDREPMSYISLLKQRRINKCSSFITNSSESLPSLPEEEAGLDEHQHQVEDKSWSSVLPRPSPARQRLLATRSEINLHVHDDQLAQRKRISSVFSELLQTEMDYIRALQYVIDNYISELARQDVPQTLRGKRHVIFGNWEKIYAFHSQHFYSQLRLCQDDPLQIGRVFVNNVSEFFFYALYSKNKPKSDEIMCESGNAFFKTKQRALQDKLDLGSYLLKPVQRMGKYALLLKQIIKDVPDTEPEHGNIQAALDMMRFYLRHGNDLLAMDSVLNSDVNLQEQGMLLRQDEMMVVQGRKRVQRRVFLFEELVIFCKTRKTLGKQDVYDYKTSLKISDIGLTENLDSTGTRFEIWIRKKKAREVYILQAPSAEIKTAWVNELSNLLWKQARRNREQQLSVNVQMGVGSKPCMNIKRSRNNISSRAVPLPPLHGSQTNYRPAHSTVTYSQAPPPDRVTTRPQSIISMTSSSDCSWSASSSSGYSSSPSNGNALFGSLDQSSSTMRPATTTIP